MATDSLSATLQLLQSLSGKGNTQTTSGGTRTEQTILDQDTLNATLRSALESNQGLASLAAGQNASGLYSSTVNQQMTNDLLARLTTNAAVAGAPKVTTSPPTITTNKNPGIVDSLGPLALMTGGKKLIDKVLNGGWDLGGAADTAVSAGNVALDNMVNTTTLSGVEAASGGGNTILDLIGSGAGDVATNIGSDVGGTVVEDAGSSLFGDGEGFLGTAKTVICTEAARQGLISNAQFQVEVSYLKLHPINSYVISGYHWLATPVVAKMKKNFRVAKYFAKWARAFIEGHTFAKPTFKYYFIIYALFPLCYCIGRVRGKESSTYSAVNSGV